LHRKGIDLAENPMRLACPLLVAIALAAPIADAKLPPPTPEEIAAEQAKKNEEAARLEREKALLEKAQDRVAERYRNGAPRAAGGVSDTNMPNNVKQRPAAPQGGRDQSAEAHSAPAK
jgi:hypothetical protein